MKKHKEKGYKTPIAVSVIISACIVFSLSQPGFTSREHKTGKDILTNAVEAIGGMKKAIGWKTRIEKGTLTAIRPGWGTLRAKCTVFIKKPDKMKYDQDYSAYDHPFFYTFYYNGGEVWVNVNLGIRQHPVYTERLTKHMKTVDGIAYYLTNCDTFFVSVESIQDSLVTHSDITRVGVVDNGDTVLFDVDGKTHLPVRRIEDSGSTHVLLDDYRTTGGVKMPHHVTIYENGTKAYEYVWDEIKFNEKIDDAIFEEDRPPAEKSSE